VNSIKVPTDCLIGQMIHNSEVPKTLLTIDRTDQKILELLQEQGRMGTTEIARRVSLSQPAVSARIKRLEQAGVITGYSAHVDPKSLGFAIHAVVRLRATQAQVAPALALFADLPEVVKIYRITGEDCFILDVHATDAERLESVVDAIARFGPVSTSLVLRDYPTRGLGLART
jgi:Lrp/AsnC family leucine-responsive transcriptional regulator